MWLATCCVLDCVGIVPPGRFLANLAKRGGWQVAVSVRNSTVAGLGVFVHDAHPEGTLLWRFDPDVGLSFGNSLADCMAIVESLGLTPAERTCDSKATRTRAARSLCIPRISADPPSAPRALSVVRIHGYGYKENSSAPSFWRLANDMGDFVNRPTSLATDLNMRSVPEDGFDFSTAHRPVVQQEELFEDYVRTAKALHPPCRILEKRALPSRFPGTLDAAVLPRCCAGGIRANPAVCCKVLLGGASNPT